jgi:tungstate transport system ATP-binding protein
MADERERSGTVATELVRLRAVSYRVRDVSVLRDISLSVHAGERIALLGANGAGKTSLLRVIHRMVAPTEGEMSAPVATAQAMIFQKPPLLKRSVLENISYVLRVRGADKESATTEAMQTLDRCGLAALHDRYARALSGGEQQRLALARAWALKPQLLLADEPTAALSPAASREIESVIQAMCAAGTTMMFSTHNRGQVKRLATRVLFMHGGRVVEDTSVQNFFSAPTSKEAIDYLNVERS